MPVRAEHDRAVLAELLGRDPVLPARLWAHLSPGLEATVARWYQVSDAAVYHRMALTDLDRLAGVTPAGGAVAALCARLRAGVDHVTLNVRADDTAVVRLYERLGFTRVADFTECALHRRMSA